MMGLKLNHVSKRVTGKQLTMIEHDTTATLHSLIIAVVFFFGDKFYDF